MRFVKETASIIMLPIILWNLLGNDNAHLRELIAWGVSGWGLQLIIAWLDDRVKWQK